MLLRVLSAFGAGLVFIASPVVLDPSGHGLPGWTALAGLFCIGLMATSFLYVAAMAPRIGRRPVERKRASLLLLIPAAGAVAMLATGQGTVQLLSSGALLAFTIVLMMVVLFPDARGVRERRLRRNMRRDPQALFQG